MALYENGGLVVGSNLISTFILYALIYKRLIGELKVVNKRASGE